ncbi:MAG: MFS transporter [Firmicutes bacterium]|nr:MFS transporter [Bacillota bacterium]
MELAKRNRWAFSLGTVGRDMVYSLFTLYLMAYIMYTKSLDNAQYAAISMIFVGCRVFDALIDPFIGGMVDRTRSRFGKFKPWIFAGMIGAAIDVVLVFTLPVYGWAFVGFIAVGYVMFSITYSLNDISYWGMLPALSSRPDERNRLVSLSNICAGAGAAPIVTLVPIITAGQYTLGGSAIKAYAVCAVVSVVCMVGFQCITLVGVKGTAAEAPAEEDDSEKIGFKQTVKTLLGNGQLMCTSVVLLLQGIISGIFSAGMSMAYIYLVYGYNGMLFTLSLFGGVSTVFVVFLLPQILARISRKRFFFLSVVALGVGAVVMLISGFMPKDPWLPSFIVFSASSLFTTAGSTAMYQIMFIDIANTVEYNQWKTGRRSEALIFSMRPLMTQMASAFTQLINMIVFLALGISNLNRGISELENAADQLLISGEEKLAGIQAIIGAVPQGKAFILLLCLVILPVVIGLGAYLLYKKYFILDEKKYGEILADLEAGKTQQTPQESALAV